MSMEHHALQNDIFRFASYWRWLDRRLGLKNGPRETLQRRTMSTATMTLTEIADIPFEKLSSSLYFICEDIGMEHFVHRYEAQMELAGAAPEKFAKGLHRFFNETAIMIRKEGLYTDFFDFISICGYLRLQRNSPQIDTTVVDCYFSLLLQQLEYLRPDKFNLQVRVCGLSTRGEVLVALDCFPNLDLPGYEIDRAARENAIPDYHNISAWIQKVYLKAGYEDIRSLEDLNRYVQQERSYTNHLALLLPFINEYTFDIIPTELFSADARPLYALQFRGSSVDELTECLRHRNRMLPVNGVVMELGDGENIRRVVLKEYFYDDTVYMLYRVSTKMGDLSGFYNTRSGFFFTILLEAYDPEAVLVTNFKSLILYLYSCAVARDSQSRLDKLPRFCWYIDEKGFPHNPVTARMFLRGGKPKKQYLHGTKLLSKQDEKYESVEREFAGFIRKVGPGRSPSARAVAYAESLGFNLMPDETYVRPFTKHVLRLRKKDS